MAAAAGTGAVGGSTAGAGGTGTSGSSSGGGSGRGGNFATGGLGGASVAGAPEAGAPGGGLGGSGGATAGMGGVSPMAGGGGMGGAAAGAAGSETGGMAGGTSSTADYTCNEVIGIDSTGEWFTSGFETEVDDAKWQIVYHHPGYVEDWMDPNDDVYKLTPTSACAMNSGNPDRIIFNMFQDTADTAFANKNSWIAGLNQVVTNLKTKYSRLKRVDLLTMTRAPDNMACDPSNRAGSVVEQYVDDAVTAVVSSGPPAVVASPKFFAPSCDIFTSGGPHFTDAGKPIAAKLYGDYYSTEP